MRWFLAGSRALVTVLLTTASSPAIATTTTGVGDYVALGLGQSSSTVASTASLRSSLSAPFSNSSAQQATNNGTVAQGTGPTAQLPSITSASGSLGGTGLASAMSCLSSLSAYQIAMDSYYDSVESSMGTTPTSTLTETTTQTEGQRGAETCSGVTSLTTLCDGHPRVVGSASCQSIRTHYTITTTYQEEIMPSIPDYPSPTPPCWVSPSDCQKIYSLNSSLISMSLFDYDLCTFTVPDGISTNSQGWACNNCQIGASAGRVLYWPVRTVSVPGSDNLCNATSVKIIGGTPTGAGPNTFVTEGITITSPSVGISLAGVSRYDDCGPTVSSTIVVVAPSEVSSVRGARALFTMKPFAFQDLNYRCQAANSSHYTIQDEPGDDCYQEVPAAAYFGDRMAFDDWNVDLPSALFTSFTIGNDYRPMLEPPYSWTSWANALYNTTGCLIGVDGIWDPPKVLTQISSEASATLPVQTSRSSPTPISSSAVPAESAVTQPPLTSTSETSSVSTVMPEHTPSPASDTTRPASSSHQAPSSSADPTSVEPSQPPASPSDNPATASTSSADPTAIGQSHSVAPSSNVDPAAASSSGDPTSIDQSHSVGSSSNGQLATSSTQQTTSCDVGCELVSILHSSTSPTNQASTTETETDGSTTASTETSSAVATVINIGSQAYTQISSESSYIVLANAETTSSMAASEYDALATYQLLSSTDGVLVVADRSTTISVSSGATALPGGPHSVSGTPGSLLAASTGTASAASARDSESQGRRTTDPGTAVTADSLPSSSSSTGSTSISFAEARATGSGMYRAMGVALLAACAYT